MDILFFIRTRNEPAEYSHDFCDHITHLAFFMVGMMLVDCFSIVKMAFTFMWDGIETRLISLVVLFLLFLSLMLIYYKNKWGVYLWGLTTILPIGCLYWFSDTLTFVVSAIVLIILQLCFMRILFLKKDGKSAWKVLFS